MATSRETASFRVITDNVHLPELGITIPQGDYGGHIEWMHVWLRGREIKQMGKAMIHLDENAVHALGMSDSLVSADCNILKFLSSGDVKRTA